MMRVIELVKEVMTKVAVKVLPVVTVEQYNELEATCEATWEYANDVIKKNLELEKELDKGDTEFNNLLKDYEWLIADANNKLDIVEGQRDETVKEYNELGEHFLYIESLYKANQKKYLKVESKVTDLEAINSMLIDEIRELEGQVNSLNYQIDTNELSAAWEIMDGEYN